jgi:hypothetical protein
MAQRPEGMNLAEIRAVTTHGSKRAEIIRAIANYEKKLTQAPTYLAHVPAVIAISEASGDVEEIPSMCKNSLMLRAR